MEIILKNKATMMQNPPQILNDFRIYIYISLRQLNKNE